MTADELKKSILQLAIQGKLVPATGTPKTTEKNLTPRNKGTKPQNHSSLVPLCDNQPFPIPENWEWKKLGEICELQDGEKLAGTPFPNLDAKFLRGKSEAKILQSGKFVPAGTRMILVDGENSGEVFTTPIDGYLGSTFKVLVISPTINVDYILHFLAYYQKTFRESKTGSAIPHLNKKLFRDLPVPVPPVEEQARIVAKLEEILPLVEIYGNAEKELSQLQKSLPSDLKKSILQAAIQGKLVPAAGTQKLNDSGPFPVPANWKWKKLGEIGEDENSFADGPFGSNLKRQHYTTNREVRIIQLSNIGEDGWREENTKYTTFEHAKTLKRSCVNSGEIVIAKMMPAGRAIIVPANEKAYILSSDAVKFVPHHSLNVKFLVYAINSPFFREQVADSSHGVTRIRTSLKKLKECFVPVPPIEEQEKIVAKLDEIFALFSAFPREL